MERLFCTLHVEKSDFDQLENTDGVDRHIPRSLRYTELYLIFLSISKTNRQSEP